MSFAVKSILSLITLAASFALAILIRYGIQAQSSVQDRQKLIVLYRLGISRKSILRAHAKKSLTESFIGTVVTLIIFVGYRCSQERDILMSLSDYHKSESASFAMDIATRCFEQTSWLFVAVILAFTLVLNFSILMLYDYKHTISANET